MKWLIMIGVVVGLTAGAEGQTGGVDEAVKQAFSRANNERVAVIGVGDSNQRFGGKGWSHFMAEALMQKYGSYAVAVRPYNQSVHHKAERPEIPEAFKKQRFSGWFLPQEKSVKSNYNLGGIFIGKGHPMDSTGPLAFHLEYGTFAESGGSFQPALRRNEAPWTLLAKMAEPVSTQGEANGLKRITFTVPADPKRTSRLLFSTSPVKATIKGPFFGSFLSCENTEKTSGIAYHTLYAAGGQSLVDMLMTFQKYGKTRLANFLSQARFLLRENKTAIFMISSALNDRNEKIPSKGPEGGLKGNSPEAFYDNLKGIVETLTLAWTTAGGEEKDLFFAFMPSHVIKSDASLERYRKQALKLAEELGPRAGCINLPELVPYTAMRDQGYYDKGRTTGSHLSPKGYKAISEAFVAALTEVE